MATRRGMTFERGTEEFARYLNFSDAVFAIAMTIIVVGIDVPHVDSADLRQAVLDLRPAVWSFFISFAVLGFYWLANNRFTNNIQRVETGYLLINLAYLSMIAFIPFPTALVGQYEAEETSVIIYAVVLGIASLCETALYFRAQQKDLFRIPLRPDQFRYGVVGSLVPSVVFALSIPIAYAFGSSIALLSWLFLNLPLQWAVGKALRPADAPHSSLAVVEVENQTVEHQTAERGPVDTSDSGWDEGRPPG